MLGRAPEPGPGARTFLGQLHGQLKLLFSYRRITQICAVVRPKNIVGILVVTLDALVAGGPCGIGAERGSGPKALYF